MNITQLAFRRFSMFSVLSVAVVIALPETAAAQANPPSSAQAYPAKPIRIVVTSTPGSGPDVISRLISARLGEAWGQQVIVDNRAGASGSIGAEIAAASAPDGYTLMVMTAQHVIVASLFDKLKYDLMRDFAPVSLLGTTPFILVVHPSLPARSVKTLVALARARPGQLHYGSGGPGSPPHLSAEIFRSMTGIDLVHVPYKGVTPALVDTVAGHVQMAFAVIPASLPLIKTRKVAALGVTSAKRTSLVPGLPTIAETVPGYEFIGWYSLVVPAKTPAEIVERLNGEVTKVLAMPEVQTRIAGLGIERIGSTPQELASHIRAESKKLRMAVKAANLRRE